MTTPGSAFDAQILELSKELSTLDVKARSLRHEVSALEHARHAREMYFNSVEHRNSEASLSGTSPKQQGHLATTSHTAKPPAPTVVQEFVDELNAKISQAKLTKQAYLQQCEERRGAKLRLERARALFDVSNKELSSLYATGRWQPGTGDSTRECPIVLKDEASRIKKRTLDLYGERQSIENIVQQQNKEMAALVLEIDQFAEADEELKAHETEAAVQKQTLKSIREEIDALTRLLKKKDKMYESVQSKSEHSDLRELETTKRITQTKLSHHKEQVRINDTAIRHRAITISKLMQRLEWYGEALRGDATENCERVDVEVVEAVRREADILAKESQENQQLLAQLDIDMEDLEHRVRALGKATQVTEEEGRRRRKEHERYLKLVEEQLEAQRMEAASYLQSLQAEIDVLRDDGGGGSSSANGAT